MRQFTIFIILFAVLGLCGFRSLYAEAPFETEWIRQFGAADHQFEALGVAVDSSGNSFVTGDDFNSNGPGIEVAYLAKYDATAHLLWYTTINTSRDDIGNSVAVDSSGFSFIGGQTGGNVAAANAGLSDAFLAKYDSAGNIVWARQFGTSSVDEIYSTAVDGAGNVYVTGSTSGSLFGTNAGAEDIIVAKYNSSGSLQWSRQLGSTGTDRGLGIAVDNSGNAYVTGFTDGSLASVNAGGDDVFLLKYDSTGTLIWTKQVGSSLFDQSRSVALDGAGNVYIGGTSSGSLYEPVAPGHDTAFVAKYDSAGNKIWGHQTASANNSVVGTGIATDSSGNVLLTGYAPGTTGGPDAGGPDILVKKYDSTGATLWTVVTGSTAQDLGIAIATNASGDALVAGTTDGGLGAPPDGTESAFLMKFGPASSVPEPGTLWLLAAGLVTLSLGRGLRLLRSRRCR